MLTAFISPYWTDRERARDAVGNDKFHEVYVSASLDVCEGRDPTGLYGRARAGEIADFTGISGLTPLSGMSRPKAGGVNGPDAGESRTATDQSSFVACPSGFC